ncbi:MAG: hypothetical protein COA99_01840 [Moraxellaceae bacterium]|nr:MAG: hypothetical protein COA99_01840 [Moraxellaceae bacterium]
MSLVLTIVRHPKGIELAQTRMTFGASGGTIGRNAENDWQLPDPERFVSSRHASIRCENGQYYLVDTSTNGVYYNNTEEALGTGNQAALSEGDRLYFGEYELLIEFEQNPAADNMNMYEFDKWLDPEVPREVQAGGAAAGGAGSSVGNDFLSETEELDPLAALDSAVANSNEISSNVIPDEDWLGGGSQADNARATEQAFTPPQPSIDPSLASASDVPSASAPQSSQGIPNDWDIDDLLGGEPAAASAEPESAPAEISKKQSAAPPPSAPSVPAASAPIPDAPSSGPKLDEIESLLAAEVSLPEVQQERMEVAQQETDELDAFLGLSGESAAPASTPTPAPTPSPATPTKTKPVAEKASDPTSKSATTDQITPAAKTADAVVKKPSPPRPAKPSPTKPSSAKPSSAKPAASEKASQPAESPQSAPVTDAAAVDAQTDALISSLGLDPSQISPEQKQHFTGLMADILRESTKGLMAVLGARNAIKNEFRMNVTLIQAAENNPLKFSPNVDEALKNMFVSQNNAYLPGILAVRHGFQDIADHQIAVIAGMRQAFNAMMKQFDPNNLAMRFEKQSRSGLMKGKSAKNWESYTEFYQELSNNMEDSFQDLFGEDFAEAYEQQMNTLASSRKK